VLTAFGLFCASVDWEEEMKRFWTIMLVGLLIAAVTAPALAWEFAMTGEAEWRYRYFARQGGNDLFGASAGLFGGVPTGTIGFAGPVANTVLVQGFAAKGADASIADSRVWLFPEIRLNPAIRLRGEYWVTGTNLRALYDGTGVNTTNGLTADNWTSNLGYTGWYIQSDGNPGNGTTPSGMTVGMWEKFWATAQTPWGIIAIGRRPFPFGTGWSTLHEKDANTETYLIVVPYGPMNFLFGQGLRTAGDVFVENSIGIVGVANTAPTFPQAVNPARAAMGTDKNRIRPWDGAVAITYNDGPVQFGTIPRWVIYWDQHTVTQPAGPGQRDDNNLGPLQSVLVGGATPVLAGTPPMYGDIGFLLWDTYFKYFNGRFFLNADYAFEYADVRRKGGRPVSVWADSRQLEIGAICGPTKISASYFYHSGHDRRGGVLAPSAAIGNTAYLGVPSFAYDWWTQYLVFGGAKEAINPYQFLLGIYGAGNNSFDARGYCTFNDFEAYAGRFDYAVASNLNVFGTFMYANRASNTGTGIGTFAGGATPRLANPLIVANVPDNYLGWEGDVGLNWKLLEGMTFNALFAYWQPGDWFKWAYQDYGSLVTTTVSGGTYSVNPNRGIDPIIGFQTSVLFEF
jgi:hypothetical protein